MESTEIDSFRRKEEFERNTNSWAFELTRRGKPQGDGSMLARRPRMPNPPRHSSVQARMAGRSLNWLNPNAHTVNGNGPDTADKTPVPSSRRSRSSLLLPVAR